MSGKSATRTKGAFGGKRGKIRKAQRLWLANKALTDTASSSGDSSLTLASRLKKKYRHTIGTQK